MKALFVSEYCPSCDAAGAPSEVRKYWAVVDHKVRKNLMAGGSAPARVYHNLGQATFMSKSLDIILEVWTEDEMGPYETWDRYVTFEDHAKDLDVYGIDYVLTHWPLQIHERNYP